ncbi:MAG: hypothetical protein Q9166_003448 [cf. Caloplaca sp. 2 TL-2023]
MSGAVEADLELGIKVNMDATRQVFDTLRRVNPKTRVTFTSTTAAYGPPPSPGFPLTEANAPSPGSSYGAQKLISETLLHDYSRRGLLDGRIICSPWTVVRNLLHTQDVPATEYEAGSRVVNLPGLTVSSHDMLEALKAIGGQEALDLIEEKRDAPTEKIVESWTAKYDTLKAKSLGFADDGTLEQTLKQYMRTMESVDEEQPGSIQNEIRHERSNKRRKIAGDFAGGSVKLNTSLEDYLCFARVDICLVFASQKDRQQWPVFGECLPRTVKLNRIETTSDSDSTIRCQITAADGEIIVDAAFQGECPPRSFEILQKIIDIPRISQKKTAARVFCTLSHQVDTSEYSDGNLSLCARILLPNNGELLQASVFDRRLVLDHCGINGPPSVDRRWSPRDFYESVFVPDKKALLSSFPRIDQLKCQLYPFQQRAIWWLFHRERGGTNSNSCENSQLPHGFVKTLDADGKGCFISLFLGIMTDNESLLGGFAGTKGGILAEEMGLGKTVEMIGLICLHPYQRPLGENTASGSLLGCAATLIITPPSILGQWKNELQTMAPSLRIAIYEGLRVKDPDDNENYLSSFDNHDIVLTTYNVLAREIHRSGHVPERDFRNQKKYKRRLSPLTQRMWWRVVLDEAQMIESGVSNAAKVAQLIPRFNAWCVSGTPVRKNSQDLRGLLVFLRFPPYCYSPHLWERLITERRDIFWQIFGTLALRHTKEQIKDDIQLPPQRRVMITVPFTQIEKQNYSNLYNQMCEECGLDGDGNPTSDRWDPDAPSTVEKMRSWLLRLRQTCLHAEVGVRNRKALGRGNNPLRTVDEVLEVMTEQNSLALRTEERALLISQARRGQLLEHVNRSKEALGIWLETLKESQSIVSEARIILKAESRTASKATGGPLKESAGQGTEAGNQSGASRQRLRSALELEHMLLFFVGNGYFQIKSDENETKPGSSEFHHLEKKEEAFYEKAKLIRKEIIVEARDKADSFMKVLREMSDEHSFAVIPGSRIQDLQGGIESRNILEKLEDVTETVDNQARQINEWRAKASKLLLVPLVDEEDNDLQGDEYETSTQQQDTVYSYVDALRAIVADLHDLVTGQRNMLIDHEMRVALRQAVEGGGHSPELLKELLGIRQGLKPPAGTGSVRGIIADLRELRNTLRGQLEKGSLRAGTELGIVNNALNAVQSLSAKLSKAAAALEHEVELFRDVMNARLEYYRQLQQISDTVTPNEDDLDEQALAAALAEADAAEGRLRTRIANLKSTARYLDHLRSESSHKDVNRFCIICQQSFEIGVLTSCGHSYCAECLGLWRKHHMTCPTCKKRLNQTDLYQITYKPLELTVQEEIQARDQAETMTEAGSCQSIYTDISACTLDEIKNIDIDAKRSFGTKIDSIARHIMWLRERDPGSKSIVFTQFRDFLSVLGMAFASYRIGYASIDGKNGVERFKNDAGIECLLMHAKGSSSGLTLVNATHVFLCEPLINTAIELQAIARVHRIGQQQATTVWVYVVENTVEKSVYEISVERRMAHIGAIGQAAVMEKQIEAADRLELEGAALGKLLSGGSSGGEVVDKDDLWNCLFRHRPTQMQEVLPTVEREVGRHLRAAAGEERRHNDEIS